MHLGSGCLDRECVEKQGIMIEHLNAQSLELLLKYERKSMHFGSNTAKTTRAMVHGVHSRHIRKQGLSRANIRSGFLTTNVLLTRLQR